MIPELTTVELKELIKTGVLILVDFSATWCDPCKLQHIILKALEQQYNGKVTIVTLDVDKNREFIKEQQIRFVPTIQFYQNGKLAVLTVKGEQIKQLTGVKSLEMLQTLINSLS